MPTQTHLTPNIYPPPTHQLADSLARVNAHVSFSANVRHRQTIANRTCRSRQDKTLKETKEWLLSEYHDFDSIQLMYS